MKATIWPKAWFWYEKLGTNAPKSFSPTWEGFAKIHDSISEEYENFLYKPIENLVGTMYMMHSSYLCGDASPVSTHEPRRYWHGWTENYHRSVMGICGIIKPSHSLTDTVRKCGHSISNGKEVTSHFSDSVFGKCFLMVSSINLSGWQSNTWRKKGVTMNRSRRPRNDVDLPYFPQ